MTRTLADRVDEQLRRWNVAAEQTLETESSFVVFGKRGPDSVVVKVSRATGDEWLSGDILRAFDGQGTVRVYDYVPGAVLLERLNPATPLSSLALNGQDDQASDILADVINRMSVSQAPTGRFTTVEEWGNSFSRYLASGDAQIPKALVTSAHNIYADLCKSQRNARLLHGDLQHYNVLFDSSRGWTAIDPKGVVGELEYELGAALRNPYEDPQLFASADIVERRIKRFEAKLKLDPARVLRWAFAQAVLSAIWLIEDRLAAADSGALSLAAVIQPML